MTSILILLRKFPYFFLELICGYVFCCIDFYTICENVQIIVDTKLAPKGVVPFFLPFTEVFLILTACNQLAFIIK